MSASNTSSSGGVDLQTLVITAIASAAAAYVTSELWAPGTLASAAITPVIVALVKEWLARPVNVVTRAVPVRGVVRSARVDEPDEPVQPFEPAEQRVAQAGEIPGRSSAFPRRAWRMAIVTGLLGFVVAAVIITVPEFVSGKSVLGGGRDTTLFDTKKSATPSTSTTTEATPTETETAPPTGTVTVPPVETTTVPPVETTAVPPTQTTPLPPAPSPPVTPEPVPQTPVP